MQKVKSKKLNIIELLIINLLRNGFSPNMYRNEDVKYEVSVGVKRIRSHERLRKTLVTYDFS